MSAKMPQATLTLKQVLSTRYSLMVLKTFMLRQQVLKLYRSFLRTIRDVPDEEGKKELLEWARSDFKTNKHHTDEYAIKMLICHGERQLKQLQQNVAFSR